MNDDFDKVTWGILGTANIAEQELIPALKSSEFSELYGVGSRDQDKSEDYADRNNIPVSYGSYEDLLSDPEIEAIYNPLPNSLHFEWTKKSAKAGKNILCEKPMALDAQEAEEMFEICESEGVLLMEAFMYRFHPQTKRVKELMDKGKIGEPGLIRASHSFPLISLNRADDIRWKEELGGGSLMDLGCYCVNSARYLFDEDPREVYASAMYHPDHSAEAQLQGILEFSDDRMAMIDSSFLLKDRAKYEVAGRDGKILVNNAYRSEGRDLEFEIFSSDEKEVESIEGVDEFRLEVDNFSKAVRGIEDPMISREDTIGNMKTIDALYRSAKENSPVKVD